jgi:hypothetical protein
VTPPRAAPAGHGDAARHGPARISMNRAIINTFECGCTGNMSQCPMRGDSIIAPPTQDSAILAHPQWLAFQSALDALSRAAIRDVQTGGRRKRERNRT